jgi:lipopolysaccharide transport system ATP-binding protein
MSSKDIAISVRGLSKAYTIAHDQEKHSTLAETLLHRFRRPLARPRTETFWALKDVSFDIKKGEVVGIIGRNGAGKSTLLKILSRITEPTTGAVDLYGRVGSLLEVGTGFHPELTGRENIYLNGAILGMRKQEIAAAFDSIVDFSGVEQFLDTPVKRYSSGMYVRLAFAVAAHLNPEILVVDEVLAVGDAEFQKKCMGKMEDVARNEGRTVLFVSHNMAAIEHLCAQSLLLRGGGVTAVGETSAIVSQYLKHGLEAAITRHPLAERTDRTGNQCIAFTGFRVEDIHGNVVSRVRSGMDVVFALDYRTSGGGSIPCTDVGISLSTTNHQLLTVLYSSYVGQSMYDIPPTGTFRCRISRFPFAPGRYVVGARVLADSDEADWPRDGVAIIEVEAGNYFDSGSAGFEGSAPLLMTGNWCAESRMDSTSKTLSYAH